MLSEPKLEQRAEQHYAAIRTLATIPFGPILGPLWGEVFGWLGEHGIAPTGAPFIRYIVINMESQLELEVGVPIDSHVEDTERITIGHLPAGVYQTALFTGDYDGLMEATGQFLAWAAQNGVEFKHHEVPEGDMWDCRLESYLNDPTEIEDPAKWETELAFLTNRS